MKELQQEIAFYANENMVRLNVYVRDPYVKKFLTEEKITEINFVGTVGGLMGLFSGFSFISVLEILYFFLCSPWMNLRLQNENPPEKIDADDEEQKDLDHSGVVNTKVLFVTPNLKNSLQK